MNYNQYQQVNPTEISYNLDVAMPYGEMPNEALLAKFEETQDLDDGEDQYDNYARDTLKDFSPDPVTMEQNMPRKDYVAQGRLNVLYNGGRGKENTPAHPEMFLGLTEREPRGVSTDPDMRKLVDQEKARMRFVRWSADADNSISQGRWSESEAFHKSRYLTHKAVKSRARIFTTAKDGRREGMRREYYPHVSNVNKVQEDLNFFRPKGSNFTDYITDFAITPQRKTAHLSDTILTNSRLYHRFTTDHEFQVAKYGEDHRRSRLTEGKESRVDGEAQEYYFDIPGGELVDNEDESKAFKAAGFLMGALVTQKHNAEKDQLEVDAQEGESGRKTAALNRDLNIIMHQIETSGFMGVMDPTLTGGKNPTPVRAEHLMRVQESNHVKPAHHLLNAELMYKSLVPGADISKLRGQMVNDDRKTVTSEDLTIFGKTGRNVAATGKRDAIMTVDGKSLNTATYKTGRMTSKNTSTKLMAAATEGFGGKEDRTLNRKQNHVEYANPSASDIDPDYSKQFFRNHEHSHRAFYRGGDKFGMNKNIQLGSDMSEFP